MSNQEQIKEVQRKIAKCTRDYKAASKRYMDIKLRIRELRVEQEEALNDADRSEVWIKVYRDDIRKLRKK